MESHGLVETGRSTFWVTRWSSIIEHYQANVRLRHGEYGNAILSRLPFEEMHDIELTVWPKKPRRAQLVKCRLPGRHQRNDSQEHSRTIVVVNLHLGLAAFERRARVRTLLENETLVHAHRTIPIIIAGDFNDVWQNMGTRSFGNKPFERAMGPVKTFPAAFPLRSLDGVYYRGAVVPIRAFAGHTKLARQASDHLPVVVEFEIEFPEAWSLKRTRVAPK